MKDEEKNILTLQIIGVYCNFGGKKNMKFYGLLDANNKPFGRLLLVEIQVIIMFWASVAETNDKRKKSWLNSLEFQFAATHIFLNM